MPDVAPGEALKGNDDARHHFAVSPYCVPPSGLTRSREPDAMLYGRSFNGNCKLRRRTRPDQVGPTGLSVIQAQSAAAGCSRPYSGSGGSLTGTDEQP